MATGDTQAQPPSGGWWQDERGKWHQGEPPAGGAAAETPTATADEPSGPPTEAEQGPSGGWWQDQQGNWHQGQRAQFEATAVFDKREQLEKLEGVLLDGEQVLACFDMKGGGTGFVGVTSKRLVVYDKAFLAKMKAIVSIPFREVVTVAAADNDRLGRGFFGSSVLTVTARNGQVYTFEFRSSEKAHTVHTLLLSRILD